MEASVNHLLCHYINTLDVLQDTINGSRLVPPKFHSLAFRTRVGSSKLVVDGGVSDRKIERAKAREEGGGEVF